MTDDPQPLRARRSRAGRRPACPAHTAFPALLGAALALLALVPASALRADDWPMWRRDAARRAVSPEELPADLQLQWLLELPEPRSAWPENQEKLQFDRLYEPVVSGTTLFVPSMVRDSLTAYDTRSGKEKWRFYAGGPVRFAAVAAEGKVWFVSDDGYLYCLDAERGTLRWKFRGGPGDGLVLGQDRMVSTWVARGAPVLYEGTIYFGASIWPFAGVFLHALDADTGSVVWTNSGTGSSWLVQQHNSPAFAGVAPQGYFAATEEYLVVSGGNTVPAVFDRETGELLHYVVGDRTGGKDGGGYEVIVGENFYLNRGRMHRLDNGGYVTNVGAPIVGEYAMIGADKEGLRGYKPGWEIEEKKDEKGNVERKAVARTVWTTTLEKPIDRVFVQSGGRLYCSSATRTVLAVDLPTLGRPALISWSVELPDTPLNVLAADSRLFVTTDRGRIYCFGAGAADVAVPDDAPPVFVAKGAEWKYRDAASPPPAGWKEPDFDDGAWSSGPGKLGYGDGDAQTKLSWGDDDNDKPLACYFRRAFELPASVRVADLRLRLLVDDGAVIYLNGEEIGRRFMPAGVISHRTRAATGTDEETYYEVDLEDDIPLRAGKNVLAVAVHQVSSSSSDLAFDLELVATGVDRAPPPAPASELARDRWTTVAEAIVGATGAKKGYGLVLGIHSARLIEELLRQTELHLVVADGDPARVDAFRRRFDDLGLYGTRVAALVGTLATLDLPSYFAELVVSELPAEACPPAADGTRALFDVLRPFSGRAAFLLDVEREARAFEEAWRGVRLDGGAVERVRSFVTLHRTAAPAGAANWTHQYADAGNSVVSRDELVKAPFGLLWFGGPSNEEVLPRHGHGPTPHVVDGRLVIEGRHMLRAVDIYTGRLLWQRELKDLGEFYDYTSHEPGANLIGSNYVSLPDGIYVVYKDVCLRLDPDTGATLKELRLPGALEGEKPVGWGYLGIAGRYLVAGAQPRDEDSPAFTEKHFSGLKDDALAKALERLEELEKFALVERGKLNDREYLAANLNKLLLERDMVGRIPAKVREEAKAREEEDRFRSYLAEVPGRDANDHGGLSLKRELLHKYYGTPRFEPPAPGKFGSDRRSGSKKLVCMDRHSGDVLWQLEAEQELRHNAIALGGGLAFCIDRLSPEEVSFRQRRGLAIAEVPGLYAVSLASGDVVWQHREEVFGTWLGYSSEHDVLVQGGSRARDRARDEVGKGLVVYRASSGDILWKTDMEYGGPPLLRGDWLITQAVGDGEGFALDLLSGRRLERPHPVSGVDVPWTYSRKYGCNTVIGSTHLLTFRSAAAGYLDLIGLGGTANLGGFRSGCTSNLIPAGGILSAPDFTRTCTCSYQNQSSLALVPVSEADQWSFNDLRHDDRPVENVGINFGAPGDRRGPDGTLWLDYPSVGGASPDLELGVGGAGERRWERRHSSLLAGDPLGWVGASALVGEGEIAVRVISPQSVTFENAAPGASPGVLRLEGKATTFSVDVPAGAPGRTSIARANEKDGLDVRVRGAKPLALDSLTLELFARVDNDLDFVDARGSGDASKQGFVIDNRELRVRYYPRDNDGKGPADEVEIKSSKKIVDRKWVHIAFSYDARSGDGRLYLDGEEVASHDGPGDRPLWWEEAEPGLVIGRGASGASRFDELRIAGRALDRDELLAAEHGGAARDVVGYWPIEPSSSLRDDADEPVRRYVVRAVFAETGGAKPGERVFDIALQDRIVVESFDIAAETEGEQRVLVKEFRDVPVRDFLRLRLISRSDLPPTLAGLQILVKQRRF